MEVFSIPERFMPAISEHKSVGLSAKPRIPLAIMSDKVPSGNAPPVSTNALPESNPQTQHLPEERFGKSHTTSQSPEAYAPITLAELEKLRDQLVEVTRRCSPADTQH